MALQEFIKEWKNLNNMKKEYHEVLKKYLFQIQDYADNLLTKKIITSDEHLKIRQPLTTLSENLVKLEPKESTQNESN